MAQELELLAKKVARLEPKKQAALLQMVAEITYQGGLEALSKKYRARLQREKKLHQRSEVILAELKHIRNLIAKHELQKAN